MSRTVRRATLVVMAGVTLTAVLPEAARADARVLKPAVVKRHALKFDVGSLPGDRVRRVRLRAAGRKYRVKLVRLRSAVQARGMLKVRTPRGLRRGSRRQERLRRLSRLLVHGSDGRRPPAGDRGGCAPSFSIGSWPGACWRPYADSSPFNQALGERPRLHPDSEQIVGRLATWDGWFSEMYAGTAETSSDYQHPIYYARPGDPLYIVERAPSGYSSDHWGTQIRIPEQARAAAGADGHLDVIQPDGTEWGLWKVANSSGARITRLPPGGGTIHAHGFGMSRIDGSGLNVGVGDANAGRWGLLGGVVRSAEMWAGEIDHALYVYVKCDNGQIVYPATGHGARCPDPTNAPAQGMRFQLAMSDAQIDALAVPAWKKTILRAMARYGMYVGDTGGSPMDLQFESGSTYTSFGYRDEMVEFAKRAGIPRSSDGKYYFDIASGVDWARYLRVVDPCVTKGTCS